MTAANMYIVQYTIGLYGSVGLHGSGMIMTVRRNPDAMKAIVPHTTPVATPVAMFLLLLFFLRVLTSLRLGPEAGESFKQEPLTTKMLGDC